MSSYKVFLQPGEGDLTLSFKTDGSLCSFDFSNSILSDKRLMDIFRNMPIKESEFITRANGGGTKYEKL